MKSLFPNRALVAAIVVSFTLSVFAVSSAQSSKRSSVNVHLVTDEAEAVLAILAKRKAKLPITETDWQRLFSSEGYTRLNKREVEIRKIVKTATPFNEEVFKAFVLSDELLSRAPALDDTLLKWKQADVDAATRRALVYLPKDAQIRAKIYPVVKPRTNSFVFELRSDPAIFLYLNPDVSREQFENTLAHELHHVGYGSGCPPKRTSDEIAKLPKNSQTVIELIGAFGEGFAILAAAGGTDVHAHAVDSAEDRLRWDKDMANFNDDLKKIERFFLDILENRLTEEKIQETASSFFGGQGAWYTVGWKMSVVIEKTYGRAKLIECICDQRKLLPTYNRAAAKNNRRAREPLALWSVSVMNGIGQRKS